jgi:three-Cys-motif partner protein
MPSKNEHYSLGDDDLLVENVGPWAKEKLKILTDYVQASSAARRKYLRTGAAFIDVFCGPGRSRIRTTGELIDGSPVAAFKKAQSLAPFTSLEISDARADLMEAAEARLRSLHAPVRPTPGPAIVATEKIVAALDPDGLHFAFLDPHNLGALSFSIIESLARLRRVDVLVHVSVSDLQRNVDRYSSQQYQQFDQFAPGWRTEIKTDMNQQSLRTAILEYWSRKVHALGLWRAKHCPLISGSKNQRLYWLILLARHDLAHDLWEKISSLARSPMLPWDDD